MKHFKRLKQHFEALKNDQKLSLKVLAENHYQEIDSIINNVGLKYLYFELQKDSLDDIVSETWLNLLKANASFNSFHSLLAYLKKATINTSRQYQRDFMTPVKTTGKELSENLKNYCSVEINDETNTELSVDDSWTDFEEPDNEKTPVKENPFFKPLSDFQLNYLALNPSVGL